MDTAEIHDYLSGVGEIVTDNTTPSPDNKAQLLHAAERHLVMLARAKRQLAQLLEVWDAIQAQQADRRRLASGPMLAEIEYRSAQLSNIQAALLALEPRERTYTLPTGTLAAKVPHAPKIDVVDPDAFIVWARANRPDLLRVKTEVDKSAVNRLPAAPGPVHIDGEIIPGLVATEQVPSFTIRIAGED
jgi:hypothetical protein